MPGSISPTPATRRLPGSLPERAGYRMAQNAGYSITETRFSPLNERADALIQALIDRIE